jgi:hypothetical protein
MRTLLLILLTAGTALAQGGAPTGPPQGPPPKNLTKQADGHISANAVPANVTDFEVYTVVAGDTLSEIAEKALKDFKLWPQLWEQNEHIVNPHWIYPNDKILIGRITKVSDATPPAPAPPPATAPAPATAAAPEPPRAPTRLNIAPYPTPPPAAPLATFNLSPPRNFSEVKDADLYCSGFIRRPNASEEMKVTSLANADSAILASDGNYIYVGKGTKDGVRVGSTYQVVRPTKSVDSPTRVVGDRDLGKHYLEIAQVQVVLVQDNTAMARVAQTCEAMEVGDVVLPYTRAQFPALPSRRPFSATMKASGQVPGKIVMTKNVLVNFGSANKGTSRLAGVGEGKGSLGDLERGIAGENRVVYLDLGRNSGARPGDLFIVFRDMETAEGKRKTAIGEVVILRVEDRAATALVTYSTDGIALGDSVERR